MINQPTNLCKLLHVQDKLIYSIFAPILAKMTTVPPSTTLSIHNIFDQKSSSLEKILKSGARTIGDDDIDDEKAVWNNGDTDANDEEEVE